MASTSLDFNTIEASFLGILSGLLEMSDNVLDVISSGFLGSNVALSAILGVDVSFSGNSWCRDGSLATSVIWVNYSTSMEQLHEDSASLGMDGIGDSLPSSNLGISVDSTADGIAISFCGDCSTFGDNETSTCSGSIVLHHQVIWNSIWTSSKSSCWCNDESVW